MKVSIRANVVVRGIYILIYWSTLSTLYWWIPMGGSNDPVLTPQFPISLSLSLRRLIN